MAGQEKGQEKTQPHSTSRLYGIDGEELDKKMARLAEDMEIEGGAGREGADT